jgi:transglutaminase-like putative cysteine protease
MALDQAFRLSSILLAATSFASLALAISLLPWLLTLAGVAFAIALLRVNQASLISGLLFNLRFSALTWNVFLLLAFAAFWIDLLLVSQELLSAGIHFLVMLLVNKLSNLDQRRDYLHLYAISLITLLASAALTTQLWYAPFFFLYLVAGVWTLSLYHLMKEKEECPGGRTAGTDHVQPPSPPAHISPRFFWTTNAMAAGAFGLTLLFFFFIPRIGVGFFQNNHGESLRTTGFTQHVDLGVIGPVKQDPSIVMRVELTEGEDNESKREPLYLRGVAYDQYNGKSWSNSLPHRRTLTELPQGTFTLRTPRVESPATSDRRLRQEILLEPLDTAVLFGAPLPVSVKGDFLSVQADLMGSLHLPFPSHARIQYTAYSLPTTVTATENRASALLYPEFILQHYLQVPAVSSQVVDLARRVTQPATSVSQAVNLIRTHLLTTYRYSLEVPSLQSAHPLEDFLLTRKTGYCEHYATAMVVLLRAVGIPARLVTGFLATEWNAFGNYYTVRQRDAHAWVEVYFPQSGWITMDPTPPVPEAAPTWWQSAGSVMDSARLKWDRLFVHYSASDQLAVVQGIREGGGAMRARMSESLTSLLILISTIFGGLIKALSPTGIPQAAIFFILIIGAGYAGIRIWRQPRLGAARQDAYSSNQRVVITLYTHMIECFAQNGIMKQASATPLEFLHHVRAQWSEAWPSADILTHLYQRVRFGRAPLTAEELSAAKSLLCRLQRSAPPSPKRS